MTRREIVLITGASGFAGSHLTRLLARHPDVDLWTCDRSPARAGTGLPSPDRHFVADLLDAGRVDRLIDSVRPSQIYHLAGQAFVGASWSDPWGTLEANVRAQLLLMDAALAVDLRPRFLVVGSMEVYGHVDPDHLPIREDQPIRPTNPYGTSKATQEMLALQYCHAHGLPVVCVRPFNHIGPGQSTSFVAPAFAAQIAAIEAGLQAPVIQVGNLSARRDFTDVRDMVRGYVSVMENGEIGQVYNIGSGVSHSIQDLLQRLLGLSPARITVEVDPARLRPSDVPDVVADTRRIRERTGWRAEIPFADTLRAILDDARGRQRQRHADG